MKKVQWTFDSEAENKNRVKKTYYHEFLEVPLFSARL